MKRIKTAAGFALFYLLLATLIIVSLAVVANYSSVEAERFFLLISVLVTLPWSFIAFLVLYPKPSSGSGWLVVFVVSAILNAAIIYLAGSKFANRQKIHRK